MQSSSSVRIFSLDRERLLQDLRQACERLIRERVEVEEVRLFGSLARGDANAFSDADVLILLNEDTESDPVVRILRYLPFFDLARGVDLLVYTRAELQRALQEENPFLQQVWSESIRLAGRG